MNKNQKTLLKLLNISIKKEKPLDINSNNINWNYIVSEAKHHDIYPLLYPSIKDIKISDNLNNTIKERWKRDALSNAIYLSKQFIQFNKVLDEFNKANIPVLVLKGMILRNYYPVPDLRTMCDADILIHREDMDKIRFQLTLLGYTENKIGNPSHHISFVHKLYNPIEVHWSLADEDYIGDISCFESQIWGNAVDRKAGVTSVMCLCNEDFLTHLFIHMAAHIRYGGFGLRQLCDLVLFLEKEYTKINWKSFSSIIKLTGIEKFSVSILYVCKELFNVNLPDELKDIHISQKETKMLINDIFDSGVFGRDSLNRAFANDLLNSDSQEAENKDNLYKKRGVLDIICPPVNSLSASYSYAKKYRLLIPIAWIHHFFAGLFHSDYTILDKIRFFFLSTLTYRKRSKLIKTLKL